MHCQTTAAAMTMSQGWPQYTGLDKYNFTYDYHNSHTVQSEELLMLMDHSSFRSLTGPETVRHLFLLIQSRHLVPQD